MSYSIAMMKVAELALVLGAESINDLEGCWEYGVDDQWWIATNGHNIPTPCSRGINVQPFSCYIEYNGWPAGHINAYGGVIAGGTLANEDTFIEALERAIGGRRQ